MTELTVDEINEISKSFKTYELCLDDFDKNKEYNPRKLTSTNKVLLVDVDISNKRHLKIFKIKNKHDYLACSFSKFGTLKDEAKRIKALAKKL